MEANQAKPEEVAAVEEIVEQLESSTVILITEYRRRSVGKVPSRDLRSAPACRHQSGGRK
ncbi:hypothetical protein AXA44_07690 [Rhodococcus sp. SC4]|uniref:hypothetical protein n=1 Tax=Rhodococcus sp. LB1 TaxID=1807499 RepID=UPI000769F6AB|nr:hypothetical protein [Rhodococcus sp. LB1]KXF53896.1 hypothetical protein AXA44_07690 [Rhodococcus sp. SC4]KXX57439.1 hypothetical protein AZG88_11565 [Rhodococcus sp. LB1]PBC57926.1 hypothetical protein CJ177_08795 [Rhodococcus sp. ACPA1]